MIVLYPAIMTTFAWELRHDKTGKPLTKKEYQKVVKVLNAHYRKKPKSEGSKCPRK